MLIRNRGIALVSILIVIIVMLVLGTVTLSRSVSERCLIKRTNDSLQAFWLAEAGINQALLNLRNNFDITQVSPVALGPGGFSATISYVSENSRLIEASGFIPFTPPYTGQRNIKATMIRSQPANFYDNAIYTASDITIQGSSYNIEGNVRYGGDITDTANIHDGVAIKDASINPLALLSFQQLRDISISQGNYHDAEHLDGPFPDSFWYDETAGIPHVVFLEGSFDLSGKTKVGGFYVVGGEVIYDATISGNVAVDGAIYSRGTFTINGGGNALNINGGVWSNETVLNGGVDVRYNEDYMNAIKNLGIAYSVQITNWQDMSNPYLLEE